MTHQDQIELAPLLTRLTPGAHVLISGDDGHLCSALREAGMVVSACCDDIPAAMAASARGGVPVRAAPLHRMSSVVPFDGVCRVGDRHHWQADLKALSRLLKPASPLLALGELPATLPHGWHQEGAILLHD
ncbi:hypothetical protein ACL00X_00010 [Aeromonas diversa]|uniref:hypothetical protein n=1 Tax=Aeromonas diversa TaxID=502790 RepID=UPI0039A002CA